MPAKAASIDVRLGVKASSTRACRWSAVCRPTARGPKAPTQGLRRGGPPHVTTRRGRTAALQSSCRIRWVGVLGVLPAALLPTLFPRTTAMQRSRAEDGRRRRGAHLQGGPLLVDASRSGSVIRGTSEASMCLAPPGCRGAAHTRTSKCRRADRTGSRRALFGHHGVSQPPRPWTSCSWLTDASLCQERRTYGPPCTLQRALRPGTVGALVPCAGWR
ncbi:hypothetical protein C8Q78DRAFT_795080 [Trametes maxima]|nr:hypothetical protein C8Q78DRAFT_795080 [Trametes maxima]